MRKADELHRAARAEIAERLTSRLTEDAFVVDVGSGTGGMSAELAAALARRGGGTLLLVDAVPELLSAATDAAESAGAQHVQVNAVHADIATQSLGELVPPAHLVWASGVVHHLPDQQAGVNNLAGALKSGGVLAVAEGGLETHRLPWDLGIGEPGFEQRLSAARDRWLGAMRANMVESVSMPYGWNIALDKAGLVGVTSFSAVLNHPAPPSEAVRDYVCENIEWLVETVGERLGADDQQLATRLLDPANSEYIGYREDLYLLGTQTVHVGLRP